MKSQETLAEITADNTSFSKEFPGLQLAWDTGSTGNIKICPRLYQLANVEGWRPKRSNVHLIFGHITHSSVQTYCKARARGEDHDTGVRLAVRHCLEKAGERAPASVCQNCSRVHRSNPDEEPYVSEKSVRPKICLACNSDNVVLESKRFFPWLSDHKNKNRYTLVRTVVWYLDHYKDSTEKTVILADGSPAVELWFRFELPLKSPEGTPYILTGHLDRLTDFAGSRWFQDIKTTKNTINQDFFIKYTIDNQMSQYTVGGKIVFDEPIVGGIIDAAQVAIDFTKFQRGLIQRTPAQLDEWLKDIEYWIKQAERYAADGYWPQNDTACHQYGGCDFLEVCNKDPAIRRQKLETSFRRETWDPLKKRD